MPQKAVAAQRILFVCLGNICRSPMAEGQFTHLVREAGLADDFIIDSAGTSGWHIGEPPDRDAQRAMRRRGVDISHQRSRKLLDGDFDEFDLLIAMDSQNLQDMRKGAGNSDGGKRAQKLRLLLDYAPQLSASSVPDPWSQGAAAFEQAIELIEAGCIGLLAALREGD